jgi:hypothetical protein
MVNPSHAWSSSSDGSATPPKKFMVKIKAASASASAASGKAAAPVLLVPAPLGKGVKAAAPAKSPKASAAPAKSPKASAAPAKSPKASAASALAGTFVPPPKSPGGKVTKSPKASTSAAASASASAAAAAGSLPPPPGSAKAAALAKSHKASSASPSPSSSPKPPAVIGAKSGAVVVVHPSAARSSSSDGSATPPKKFMVKIKAASAVVAPAAAAAAAPKSLAKSGVVPAGTFVPAPPPKSPKAATASGKAAALVKSPKASAAAAVDHLIPLPQPSLKLSSSSPEDKGWGAAPPVWMGMSAFPAASGQDAVVIPSSAASPIAVVQQDDAWGDAAGDNPWDPDAIVSQPVVDLGWIPHEASAPVGAGKSSKKKKPKAEVHPGEALLDRALREMKQNDRAMKRLQKLMREGKLKQAKIYATEKGILDLVTDDPQYAFAYDSQGNLQRMIMDDAGELQFVPIEKTKTHKKSKSSGSNAGKAVAYAGESPLEIVELTPSPKASSKKASTHAKAASDLEIVELSPSPQKKHPLSFGQQVASLLEQHIDKSKKVSAFKPAGFQSLPVVKLTASQKHASEIGKLHTSLVKSKGEAVSPTFNPKAHGDWM